ncbi:hypothetical protein EV183_000258 [Coemansia sp. RSA 2336]|nr:hypothetical protein EV183_000258 [Coemansia sp. RSA 2336]
MYLDYNTLLSGAALNWLKSMAKQHKFDRGTDVTFTHVHEGFADNWLEYSKFIQTVQQGATESRLFIPSRSLPKQPVMSTNITNLDFSRLVIADSGQPLIYPYLRSLNLLNYLTEKLEQVDVDHPGPFPKLRMLNLNIENPFSAPILFKGNSQTLAHLEMHMCDRTISPLIKSKVLDHANMKALERLILRGTVNSYRELDTDEHKLAGFILSMKRIKELLIMDARVCSSLLTMLETQPFKYLTKIRILDCPLTLIGAVKAIHQMPMLRELGCKIHAAGNEFQQMTPQDMLAFLATYCRPLNNNLYEWHVTNEQFESLDHAVMFILFIANACARLELIRLSITHAQWETLSRAVLNSSIYKRYQLKLEAVFVNAFDFYWRIEH